MIIQNEPKKIAVTEAQMSALRNAYKPQMVQANEVVGTPETNESIINNIVNTPAPEVVNTPGADTLVKDAPKEEQAPVENNTNIFEQNVIVDDPSISNVKEEPEVVAPVQEEPKVEEKDNKKLYLAICMIISMCAIGCITILISRDIKLNKEKINKE